VYADAPLATTEQKSDNAAHSTATIKKLWAVDTGVSQENANTNLQTAVLEDEIILLSPKGQLQAYKKNTGQSLWKHAIGKSMKTGPVVNEEWIIVVTARSQLRAYERKSLNLRWTVDLPGDVLATPKIDYDLLIVKTLNGKIIAFDLESGTQRWFYEQITPSLSLHKDSMPIVTQGKVFAGFSDGRVVALNRDTGVLLWQRFVAKPSGLNPIARLINMSAEMMVRDDSLYLLAGEHLMALSIDNGQALWSYPVSAHNGFTIDGNMLYLIDNTGMLHTLDRQLGTALQKQQLTQQRRLHTPIIVNNALVFADNAGTIYAADPAQGKISTQQPVSKNRLNHPPFIDANGVAYFLTDKGDLIAVKLS